MALLAMILAAADGYVLEMATLHDIALSIKKRSLLPDFAYFASGNDLDRMFVHFRPGFEQKLVEVYGRLKVANSN